MKFIRSFYIVTCILFICQNAIAQQAENKISSETVEKTYTVKTNDNTIKNSVKVNTTMSLEIMFAEEDEGKIDAKRVIPPKKITKTVLIDNDEDDHFDEKIVFSYRADANSDFTLVTDNDEVVIAIENGDQLQIIKSLGVVKKNSAEKKAFVFTDGEGKDVDFLIESFETME